MRKPPSIVGVVLAGGKSSRFGDGRDKAGIVVDDGQSAPPLTLGQRAVRSLLDAGVHDVVIVGHGRGLAPELERIDDAADDPAAGAAGAVLALVRSGCAESAYVIVPVDMPGVDGALLSELLQAHFHYAAVNGCTHFDEQPLPVVLHADAQTAQRIADAFARGERKLLALWRTVGAQTIPCPRPDSLENINSDEDLSRWTRRFAGR